MNKKKYGRSVVLFTTILCLLTASSLGQQRRGEKYERWVSSPKGKKEFVFKGRVEKVDPSAKTIVVNNDVIPGWRFSMTMTYTVSNPEVLADVIPGDRVRARVYEGDSKKLYDLRIVPPEGMPLFLPRKK